MELRTSQWREYGENYMARNFLISICFLDKKDWMVMWHVERRRIHFEFIGLDMMTLLQWVSNTQYVRLWIGFIWLKSTVVSNPAVLFILYYNQKMHNYIITLYITTVSVCYLHWYVFRHFQCHHQGVYMCSSLSYTSFRNCSCWKYDFVKLRCFTSSYVS